MAESNFSEVASCKFRFRIRGLRGRSFLRNFMKFARVTK